MSGRSEALRRRPDVFTKDFEGPDWKPWPALLGRSPLLTLREGRPERSLHGPEARSELHSCSSPSFWPLSCCVQLPSLPLTPDQHRPASQTAGQTWGLLALLSLRTPVLRCLCVRAHWACGGGTSIEEDSGSRLNRDQSAIDARGAFVLRLSVRPNSEC